MSNDIGADLLRKIRAEFGESLNDKSTTAAKLLEKIEDGKGTFNDVFALSTQCGEILSKLFAKYVAPENLPDGRLYYNIAQTILESTLRENYNLINLAAQAAQEHADKELGLNIAPKKAPFPQERVDKIIGAAADDTADWNTISRRLDAPIRNVTVSFYNDYIEENAEFRSRAGLKAVVIRQTNGKCCDWCAAIAGRYEYPGVPDTVWGFHDNCTCSVLYSSSKTTSVHNRRNRQGYRLEGEERKKALANVRKPVRYAPGQAERIQNNVLNRLAFSGNGGIIRDESRTNTKTPVNIQLFAEKDIERQETASLIRAMRKYEKRIEEHKGYISNPKSHCPEWDSYTDQHKAGLIRHWEKEISNFQESIDNRIEELKRRGEYHES